MKVTTTIERDVAVLAVSGEFNADSIARFKEAVREVRDRGLRDFVVDVKDITAVDSAGLQAFSDLQRECEEQLGMVSFCGADHNLAKIFEITRLDKRLSLAASTEDALAGFA